MRFNSAKLIKVSEFHEIYSVLYGKSIIFVTIIQGNVKEIVPTTQCLINSWNL